MQIYFSDFFEVDPALLDQYGAFNVSLVNDLPLFIDPFLLFNSPNEEYQALHSQMLDYVRFLRDVSLAGPVPDALLADWFTFKEVKQNWLGFSLSGNSGSGLGMKFARALERNLRHVFSNFGAETITRGSHLEKLCLVRDGVGRDNISDFTTNLIKSYLAGFTESFASTHIDPAHIKQITLPRASFNYETRTWASARYRLPYVNGDHVLLTPTDILTKDDSWINRPDLIERFQGIAEALPDPTLRAQVNQYLVRAMPKPPQDDAEAIRHAIALAIDKFPQVIDYYIREKEDKGTHARSQARMRVAEARSRYISQVTSFVADFLEPGGFYRTSGTTYSEARDRLVFLKDMIENKGGHRIFYEKGRPISRESDLQILYRLTWYATASDVSREVNDGRGPADYKISRGAADKTIVEFKLASNRKLEQNLKNQTAIYSKASDSTHPSLKAIMYFSPAELERVNRILKKLNLTGNPHVILIDAGDDKPSGSKA